MNKLVIFDFDGTIVDSMWAWDALGRETLEENSLTPLPDYENVIRTMSVPQFSQYLSKIYPSLAPSDNLMALWHDKMVFNYLNRVSLKKGITELLEYLKQNGFKMFLASATKYEVLLKAVKHFDLEKYFDCILTEERVGATKRDPKIYLLCAEKANCDINNVFLFEDAVHALKTAKNIGIKSCGISDYSMRAHEEEIKQTVDLYLDDFTNLNTIKSFLQ